MTLTKESLREALAFLETEFTNDPMMPWFQQRYDKVSAAAGFVERLLPETCDACNLDQCEDCHGTGQLWNEGLVEVVAQALYGEWIAGTEKFKTAWLILSAAEKVFYQQMARAVLSALTQEVGK